MKRYLIIIPILLFMFLNACGSSGSTEGGVYITFTPTFTLSPTPPIDTSTLVAQLNNTIEMSEIITPIAELEHSMSARYQVLDVTFTEEGGIPALEVKVNCECAGNGQCCSHEQTFIEAMRAMYANKDLIISTVNTVPETVSDLRVYCYDHPSQVVIMYVLWEDVRSFFNGGLTGYQLASRVHH